MSIAKIQPFDGTGDVNVFLEKVEQLADLKEYEDEKHAKLIGSHLNRPAFEASQRLTTAQKKSGTTKRF